MIKRLFQLFADRPSNKSDCPAGFHQIVNLILSHNLVKPSLDN